MVFFMNDQGKFLHCIYRMWLLLLYLHNLYFYSVFRALEFSIWVRYSIVQICVIKFKNYMNSLAHRYFHFKSYLYGRVEADPHINGHPGDVTILSDHSFPHKCFLAYQLAPHTAFPFLHWLIRGF